MDTDSQNTAVISYREDTEATGGESGRGDQRGDEGYSNKRWRFPSGQGQPTCIQTSDKVCHSSTGGVGEHDASCAI